MTEERKSRHFEFSKVENGYLVSELPESNIGSPYYSVKRYAFETIDSLFQWMREYFEETPNNMWQNIRPYRTGTAAEGFCGECLCGRRTICDTQQEVKDWFLSHAHNTSGKHTLI